MISPTDDYKVSIFNRYKPGILRKLNLIVPGHEEDAFQDAIVLALTKWNSCKDESKRSYWFWSIAINSGLTIRRSSSYKMKEKTFSIEAPIQTSRGEKLFHEFPTDPRVLESLIAKQLLEIGTRKLSPILISAFESFQIDVENNKRCSIKIPLTQRDKTRRFRSIHKIRKNIKNFDTKSIA